MISRQYNRYRIEYRFPIIDAWVIYKFHFQGSLWTSFTSSCNNSFCHFKIEHVSWKGYNDNNDSLITSQYFWSEKRNSWKSQVIHIFNCGMRWVKYYLWQATRSYFIPFWRSCISDRWSKHALILGSSMQLKNFSSEKREILCCWMLFHIQMA